MVPLEHLTGEALLKLAYRMADALRGVRAGDRDEVAQVIALHLWRKRDKIASARRPVAYANRAAFWCGCNWLRSEYRRVRREYGILARATDMHRAGKFDLPGENDDARRRD